MNIHEAIADRCNNTLAGLLPLANYLDDDLAEDFRLAQQGLFDFQQQRQTAPLFNKAMNLCSMLHSIGTGDALKAPLADLIEELVRIGEQAYDDAGTPDEKSRYDDAKAAVQKLRN